LLSVPVVEKGGTLRLTLKQASKGKVTGWAGQITMQNFDKSFEVTAHRCDEVHKHYYVLLSD
jgi:hypothetical protein